MKIQVGSETIEEILYNGIPIDKVIKGTETVWERSIECINLSGSGDSGQIQYLDAEGNVLNTYTINNLSTQQKTSIVAFEYGGGYLHIMINDDSNSKGRSIRIVNSWNGAIILRITGHSNVRYLANIGSQSQIYVDNSAYCKADIHGSMFYVWGSPASATRVCGNGHLDLHFGSDANITINNPIMRAYDSSTAIVTMEGSAYVKTNNGTSFVIGNTANFTLNMSDSANIEGNVGLELGASSKAKINISGTAKINATTAMQVYNNAEVNLDGEGNLSGVIDTYGTAAPVFTFRDNSRTTKITSQGNSTPTVNMYGTSFFNNIHTSALAINSSHFYINMFENSILKGNLESQAGKVTAVFNDSSKLVSSEQSQGIKISNSGVINLTTNDSSTLSVTSGGGINGGAHVVLGTLNMTMNGTSAFNVTAASQYCNAFMLGTNTSGNLNLIMNDSATINVAKITSSVVANCVSFGYGGSANITLNGNSQLLLGRTRSEQGNMKCAINTYVNGSSATITDNRAGTDNIIYLYRDGGAITYTGLYGVSLNNSTVNLPTDKLYYIESETLVVSNTTTKSLSRTQNLTDNGTLTATWISGTKGKVTFDPVAGTFKGNSATGAKNLSTYRLDFEYNGVTYEVGIVIFHGTSTGSPTATNIGFIIDK